MAAPSKPTILLAALVTVAIASTGCAGGHLHNRANAKLATDASEAAAKLGLDEAFDRQAEVQASLLEKQIELARAFATADRDTTLARLAISHDPLRDDWFQRDLTRRIGELGVGSLEDLENARIDHTAAVEALAAARDALAETNVPTECEPPASREVLPPAELAEKIGKAAREDNPDVPDAEIQELTALARELDAEFVAACREFVRAELALASLTRGELARIDDKIRTREEDLAQARRAAKAVREKFKKVDGRLTSPPTADSGKTPSQIVAESLESASGLLESAGDLASLFGERQAVEERLQRLDEALVLLGGRIPEGADPTEAQRKVAVAFAGIPGLLDRIAELERGGKTLPRTDLVIVRGELAARRSTIAAAIDRYEAELRHLRAERGALIDELAAYRRVEQRLSQADAEFEGAVAGTALAGKSVLDLSYRELLEAEAGSGQRERMARARALVRRAIILQAHARSKSTMAVAEARLRQAAAVHESNIAQARANTAQWMAVIQPLVAQQAQYHNGGVRSEQVAALVFEAAKAAGLWAIAARVD